MADNEIRTRIVVDTKGAVKSVDNLDDSIDDLGRTGKKTGNELSGTFTSIGKAAAGFLTAEAIIGGVKALIGGVQNLTTEFAALGDQIGKTAENLGVGAEALQELRFAAEQSGVGTQTFDTALQRLTRRAAEAAGGTGVARDAFRQLGIQLRDSQGNVRATEDIFGDLAGAFEGVESQSERVRLAFQLFDTEGVALVNLLGQGAEGLEQFRERARELGFVLDEESIAAATRFQDSTNELRLAFEGLRNVLGAALLPAITEFAETITDFIVSNRDQIIGFFSGFFDVLSAVGTVIRALLVPAFVLIQAQLALIQAAFELVRPAIDFVAEAIREAADAFSEFVANSQSTLQNLGPITEALRALGLISDETAEKTRGLATAQEETGNALLANAQRTTSALTEEQRNRFETLLEQDRIFRENFLSLSEEFDTAQREQLLANFATDDELRAQAAQQRIQQEVALRRRLIQATTETERGLLIVESKLQDERVNNFRNFSSDLIQLSQSQNAAIAAIGKAAAITQITIDTARAAVSIPTQLLATIPFPPVALAIAAPLVAARIAFGAEQIARVAAAQTGGVIPQLVPGTGDRQPALLEAGELVVPRQNFDEVVNSVAANRTGVDEAGGAPATIELVLNDNLVEFVEARLIERGNLGISLEASPA